MVVSIILYSYIKAEVCGFIGYLCASFGKAGNGKGAAFGCCYITVCSV